MERGFLRKTVLPLLVPALLALAVWTSHPLVHADHTAHEHQCALCQAHHQGELPAFGLAEIPLSVPVVLLLAVPLAEVLRKREPAHAIQPRAPPFFVF